MNLTLYTDKKEDLELIVPKNKKMIIEHYAINSFNRKIILEEGSRLILKDYIVSDSSISLNTSISFKESSFINLNSNIVVFSGTVRADVLAYMDNKALNANAEVFEKALLFGGKAILNPSLDINFNELSASHGASVSQINKEDLFYLESKGIPKDSALYMLIEGFLGSLKYDKARALVNNYIKKYCSL